MWFAGNGSGGNHPRMCSASTERGRVLPLGEDRGFFDEGPAGEDPLKAACYPPWPGGVFFWGLFLRAWWPLVRALKTQAENKARSTLMTHFSCRF